MRGMRGVGRRRPYGQIVLVLIVILVGLRAGQEVIRSFVPPAEADRTADRPFDYYVLALSWSPSFCLDNPDRAQCDRGEEFILHGLWPQFEAGWPISCDSAHREPNAAEIAVLADATPDAGLVRHQWRRHGTCSGMSPRGYVETARAAWEKVERPDLLSLRRADGSISWRAVESAFLDDNRSFSADSVTVKCKSGRLSEVRICLTADLGARACGADVAADCRDDTLGLPAPR